jgi:hypothetical protein
VRGVQIDREVRLVEAEREGFDAGRPEPLETGAPGGEDLGLTAAFLGQG